MKRFKIEQSTADIINQSGLALIGQAINRYTTLTQELDTQVPLRHGIKHSDVVKSYLGLVSAGKNDFQVEWPREELFALSADAIKRWLSVNRLGDDSEIIELVREAGDRLLFLANASQEQITMEYTYRTANVAAIHDRLRSLIESDSHYRAPIKTHEQR